MDIDDEYRHKMSNQAKGYRKIIVVLVVTFCAATTAAVLATYFAKRPKNDDNIKFLDRVCQNYNYIKGLLKVSFPEKY